MLSARCVPRSDLRWLLELILLFSNYFIEQKSGERYPNDDVDGLMDVPQQL